MKKLSPDIAARNVYQPTSTDNNFSEWDGSETNETQNNADAVEIIFVDNIDYIMSKSL